MMGQEQQEIIKDISMLYRKTQAFLTARLKDEGLTGSQGTFLVLTCTYGCLPQNKFCELLDMSRGTVAKMLARLEEEGYIERRGNPDDARGMDVFPTAKTERLYPLLLRDGKDCADWVTGDMTDIERNAFYALLHKACRSIGER